MYMHSDTLINISFVAFIIIMLSFKACGKIKTLFDNIMVVMAILISLLVLLAKNYKLIDLAHFLYLSGFLIPVTLVSNNKFILLLNAIMIFNILLSRIYYGVCILNKKQGDKGFFTDLNKTFGLNWDYIFPMLLIINIFRLTTLF